MDGLEMKTCGKKNIAESVNRPALGRDRIFFESEGEEYFEKRIYIMLLTSWGGVC